MKIGLIGVNSQFVHSNLALYYLREELPGGVGGEIREFNNNEPILSIFYSIAGGGYDLVAFSVYLWNKETVQKLTQLLKQSFPNLVIVLGGPEATYSAKDFPYCDYTVSGALECTWAPLISSLSRGETPNLPGINGEVCFADNWKFPYRESDLPLLKNKLVYYETSRGCPYHCAFCLSSAEEGTALLPLERVKKELLFFLEHQISVVKLVDRTFNAPRERAKEILRFLLAYYKEGVTFHFELKGELLDDETVNLLLSAPRGYFQVEIGIQSLNDGALSESRRKNRWDAVKEYYRRLGRAENIHTHFDLIAGLPHEDLDSFVSGFNEVMTICPDYLQVGFLKLLPGTKLCRERDTYCYVSQDFPPYEVVSAEQMAPSDFAVIKKLDSFMDTVYNKGLLRNTLDYAFDFCGGDCFRLFTALAESTCYENTLAEFTGKSVVIWRSLLRLDAFLAGNGGAVTAEEERKVNLLAQDRERVTELMPHYAAEKPREIYKRIRVLSFPVKLEFAEGRVSRVSQGKTELILDYRSKGRQKRGTVRPRVILL